MVKMFEVLELGDTFYIMWYMAAFDYMTEEEVQYIRSLCRRMNDRKQRIEKSQMDGK